MVKEGFLEEELGYRVGQMKGCKRWRREGTRGGREQVRGTGQSPLCLEKKVNIFQSWRDLQELDHEILLRVKLKILDFILIAMANAGGI